MTSAPSSATGAITSPSSAPRWLKVTAGSARIRVRRSGASTIRPTLIQAVSMVAIPTAGKPSALSRSVEAGNMLTRAGQVSAADVTKVDIRHSRLSTTPRRGAAPRSSPASRNE